jgi:hypothetical protein
MILPRPPASLVRKKGFGPWQTIEHYDAYGRRVHDPSSPLIVVLAGGVRQKGDLRSRVWRAPLPGNPPSHRYVLSSDLTNASLFAMLVL